jgi:hypothetical protein
MKEENSFILFRRHHKCIKFQGGFFFVIMSVYLKAKFSTCGVLEEIF